MRSFWIIKEHHLALIFEWWKKHQDSFSKGWANFKKRCELFSSNKSYQGRISSVGRALDCKAGGRGFESRGQTISQGPKITEKWRYKWLDLPVAWMTTSNGSPVSVRRCKDSVINWHFRAKYIDTQIKFFFLFLIFYTQIKCFIFQYLTEFDKLSYGFVIEKSPCL